MSAASKALAWDECELRVYESSARRYVRLGGDVSVRDMGRDRLLCLTCVTLDPVTPCEHTKAVRRRLPTLQSANG